MSEFVSKRELHSKRSAYATSLILSLGLVGCGSETYEEPTITTVDTPTTTTDTPSPTDYQTPTRKPPRPKPSITLPEPPPPPPTETVTVTVTASRSPKPTPAPTAAPSPHPTQTVKPTTPPQPTIKPTPPRPSATETIPEPPAIDTETEPPVSRAVDCLVDKCIALTFDDGPGKYTDQLLGYLDQYDAEATFFLVGDQLDKYPSVASRIVQAGHQVGNHSTHHLRLTEMSLQEADDDIRVTQNKIEATTGVRPHIMRPPGGQTNQELVDYIDLPQILWSVDTLDWKFKDTQYVTETVLGAATRGDIILMHDIHPTTVNAMPKVLEKLSEAGFKMVTIDDLLGDNLPTDRYRRQTI